MICNPEIKARCVLFCLLDPIYNSTSFSSFPVLSSAEKPFILMSPPPPVFVVFAYALVELPPSRIYSMCDTHVWALFTLRRDFCTRVRAHVRTNDALAHRDRRATSRRPARFSRGWLTRRGRATRTGSRGSSTSPRWCQGGLFDALPACLLFLVEKTLVSSF